ncbi:hypothetical protein EON82_04475 [bacterium]|nr:MAG: hypothetical protein EON82_04475 [bacterium]
MQETSDGYVVRAQVTSERGPNGELWFELTGGPVLPSPEMISAAFVAACFPTAVWLGEDISVDVPVDADLLLRLPVLARGMARLHHRARAIEVHAEPARSEPPSGRVVGASFSGGADSFYTLMTNRDPGGLTPVGALVTGLGFDPPHNDNEKQDLVLERLRRVSYELELQHFAIRTNFRLFFDPYADPSRVTQGTCLVAFAFLLAGDIHSYLVPSSAPIDRLYRWSSHALLDGAWLSGHVRTISDGWDIHRNDKVLQIAGWPLALEVLRVCAVGNAVDNCGKCEKCLRTMALLEVAHRAEQAPTFPRRIDAKAIRDIQVKQIRKLYWWEEIRKLAEPDPSLAWLVAAINRMAFSCRLNAPRRRLRNWMRRGLKRGIDPIQY